MFSSLFVTKPQQGVNNPRGRVHIESHSAGEEVLSTSSSGDVTETEEHITVHSRREPLPWSLRKASYDRPLPGLTEMFASAEDLRPGLSPVQKSSQLAGPRNFSVSPTSSHNSVNPLQASKEEQRHTLASPAPSLASSSASAASSASWMVAGAKGVGFHLGKQPSQHPTKIISPEATPFQNREQSLSSLALGSSQTEESTAPHKLTTPSPKPLALSYFDTRKAPSPARSSSPVIDRVNISSPVRSPSPSLSAAEAGLASPLSKLEKNRTSTPEATSLEMLEAGLSARGAVAELQPNIGIKRERSTSPGTSPLLTMEHKVARRRGKEISKPPTAKETEHNRRLAKKYKYDWKVQRRYPAETFFFPRIFNEARLQYVSIPRKRRPLPRRYSELNEDVDPGARFRRDWQAQRRYNVVDFFNPQLFDEKHLQRAKIPQKRRGKKRHHQKYLKQLGLKGENDPGSTLRKHWSTSRAHPVEYFFNPSLFDANLTKWESLRQDWYLLHPHPGYFYHNPFLLSETYQRKRQGRSHQMIHRLLSSHPTTYRPHHYRNNRDPGQRYREDWQVQRKYPVYQFFEPSLFDLEKAIREASYWHEVIFRGRATSPTADFVSIPIAPKTPTLLVSEDAPSPRLESPMKDTTMTGHELINKLRLDFDQRNARGQQYDWPFWDALFSGELDLEQARQDVINHLTSDQYASLPFELLPFLWSQLAVANHNPVLDESFAQLTSAAPYQANFEQIGDQVDRLKRQYNLTDDEARKLHTVIGAYYAQDPDFPDPYIAGVWTIPLIKARNLSVEQAFGCLQHMMLIGKQRQNHMDEYCGLLFAFEELLRDVDPVLASHLDHQGIGPDMYARHWYETLFTRFPVDLQAQVYALFLAEGSVALHKMALSLMVENRDRLLDAPSFADIMAILCETGEELMVAVHEDWQAKDWLEIGRCLSISPEQMDSLEALYDLLQQQGHMREFGQIMDRIEAEDDLLLGQIAWLRQEMHRLTWEREMACSALMEWRYGCKGHIQSLSRQMSRIRELEMKMGQMAIEHEDEVGHLTALLATESTINSNNRRRAGRPS